MQPIINIVTTVLVFIVSFFLQFEEGSVEFIVYVVLMCCLEMADDGVGVLIVGEAGLFKTVEEERVGESPIDADVPIPTAGIAEDSAIPIFVIIDGSPLTTVCAPLPIPAPITAAS